VDLVVHQMGELQHVDVAYRHWLFEFVSGHAVIKVRLARFRQIGLTQHRLDFHFTRAVKHRRGKVHAFGQRLGYVHQLVVSRAAIFSPNGVSLKMLFSSRRTVSSREFSFRNSEIALAQLMTGPSQVCFQDLAHVHAAGVRRAG